MKSFRMNYTLIMKILGNLCDAWEHKVEGELQLLLRLGSICAKYFSAMVGIEQILTLAIKRKIVRSEMVKEGVLPFHYLREACSEEIVKLEQQQPHPNE